MTTQTRESHDAGPAKHAPDVTGSDRRTLTAIFRHPSAHNLEWSDAVALFKTLGEVEEKHNGEFEFVIGGDRCLMRKPHTKDLTGSEVVELRKFLIRAGQAPDGQSPDGMFEEPERAAPAAPALLIVIDHHGAKIYDIDLSGAAASQRSIAPYDPHHFLHHLTHKDQSRERGQRAPEDPSFYDRIAETVAAAGKIVVIGHGDGKSNAARHLTEYLRRHHPETAQRIAREVSADLSSVTIPELLNIARDALA